MLIWALTDAGRRSAGSVTTRKAASSEQVQRTLLAWTAHKLAEMLAARGQEIGLRLARTGRTTKPSPTDYVLYVIDGVIRLYSPLGPEHGNVIYDNGAIMPLAQPDSAREASRLRCET